MGEALSTQKSLFFIVFYYEQFGLGDPTWWFNEAWGVLFGEGHVEQDFPFLAGLVSWERVD